MAINSRLFPGIPCSTPGAVMVVGNVAIGASGAVGTQTGKGFTVTRTGAGKYTIQLTSQGNAATVPAILYADPELVVNSDTQFIVQAKAAPTTGAITVVCFANAALGTPADPPSGATLQIFVIAQNTSAAR